MSIVTDIIRADITRDLLAINALSDPAAVDRAAVGLISKCQRLSAQLSPLTNRRASVPVAVRKIVPPADLHALVLAEQESAGVDYPTALETVTRDPTHRNAVTKYLADARAPKARR